YSAVCQRPCWVIIDEVHSLNHLPVLETTLVEARKYGVKMVLGTQNKAQFEEHYGRAAATMLASSHTKILFRCNEPESARWVAEMIGEEEKERPRPLTQMVEIRSTTRHSPSAGWLLVRSRSWRCRIFTAIGSMPTRLCRFGLNQRIGQLSRSHSYRGHQSRSLKKK